MRVIQRSTSARKLSGKASSSKVSGSFLNGEASLACGQPSMVRMQWFQSAIELLMILRGCLTKHSATRALWNPSKVWGDTSAGPVPVAEQ